MKRVIGLLAVLTVFAWVLVPSAWPLWVLCAVCVLLAAWEHDWRGILDRISHGAYAKVAVFKWRSRQ